MSGTSSAPVNVSTPAKRSSLRDANFDEISVCVLLRMLTPNFCAAMIASCVFTECSMQTSTSGGCKESDANEATVIPKSFLSCDVVTTVTPLAKCDMASLKRASSIGIANLRAAQCNATFGRSRARGIRCDKTSRPMKVHEYQAKEILRRYGVPTPRGIVAETADDARAAAKELGGRVVVKAQIHAGGRGKGGGVKLAKDADEAAELTKKMIGMTLITHQTGPTGQLVRKVLIEEALNIDKELYLGITLDRRIGMPVVMASKQGGMEIEEVAERDPSAIHREPIDGVLGALPFQARSVANALGLTGDAYKKCVDFVQKLMRCYIDTDASLVEINPLMVTKEGNVFALDCKMNFDDNAMFRHKDLAEMRDLNEEDPLEVEASKFGLNYITLDGNVGCMVNGAGLAMATMDIIKLASGQPANFHDVGGGANAEEIRNAFKILMSDKNVKAVLINICGGILRCDVLAQGVIAAVTELGVPVPIVIRMEGTNVEEGKRLLRESGMNFATADSMGEAATKVVELAG